MKLDKFDYFLGLQSSKELSFFNYILIDLSWESPADIATNIEGAYQLLTDKLIEGNKKILFSKVPNELLSNKLKDSTINKIIESIEFKEGKAYERNTRDHLYEKIKEHFYFTKFFPIPLEIITEMNLMYNRDSIKKFTRNPFLYQP